MDVAWARSITYNFLVADYQYSTATLSYKSVKCTHSYWLAALQHIPCVHSTFDGNGTSLQLQPISVKKFCGVFLAPTQLRQVHNQSRPQPPPKKSGKGPAHTRKISYMSQASVLCNNYMPDAITWQPDNDVTEWVNRSCQRAKATPNETIVSHPSPSLSSQSLLRHLTSVTTLNIQNISTLLCYPTVTHTSMQYSSKCVVTFVTAFAVITH